MSESAPQPDPSAAVIRAQLSEVPLDPGGAETQVWAETAGAVVVFSGIVRNHDTGRDVERLSYTAHPSAQQVIRELTAASAAQHPGVRFWAEHRVGELAIGDHALVAAAASAHRAEAFAACAALVERIKAELPIWKEQFFTDGSREWVGL